MEGRGGKERGKERREGRGRGGRRGGREGYPVFLLSRHGNPNTVRYFNVNCCIHISVMLPVFRLSCFHCYGVSIINIINIQVAQIKLHHFTFLLVTNELINKML